MMRFGCGAVSYTSAGLGRASFVGLWDPVKSLTDLGKPAEAGDRGVILQGHLIMVGISIQRGGPR